MSPATASAAAAVLGEFRHDALKLAGALIALVLVPSVLLIAAIGALLAPLFPGSPSVVGQPDSTGGAVPPEQLAVMREVSRTSGVPWELLAAIASVESDFGRNMATSWAGAIGYGQFLPSSWAAYGRGGNPYDYRDAIPAMARYLADHGAPADLPRAVYAYNHSWDYVDLVLGRAAHYATLSSAPTAVPGSSPVGWVP